MSRLLRLQPKQAILCDHVYANIASWIGAFGGRGGAKSAGIQRIMLARRTEIPGTVGAILMRNYDQVKRYHVDVMLRDYPELEPFYHKTESKLILPMASGPDSEIHFTYAESLKDVERRFRSANYYDVFVDQAEQFTEAELREIKQAVRSKNTPMGACKLVLAFNMGGAGIDFLRKKFHLKEYSQSEKESDFAGVHFFPWDNVEWVRAALMEDGLTAEEREQIAALYPNADLTDEQRCEIKYYELFTEQQRMDYCATRGDYGRNLNAQDEALKKRDWFGSWEALEGAFFGRVFDRDSTVITPEQVAVLIKPWSKRWISQDWGKGHYCTTQWHARCEVSPSEARDVLGWQISRPIKLVITYREYIAGGAAETDEGGQREIAEQDIARQIVERTPEVERPLISHFFLSPDAFEMSVRRANQSKISDLIGKILKAADMPYPSKADNARVDGWSLMYNLLLETKRHGAMGEDAWLISSLCPELIAGIPLLMRNPKNLDDVLKTDETSAKIEQDVSDAARYGLKSMLSPGVKPKKAVIEDAIRKAMFPEPAPIEVLAHVLGEPQFSIDRYRAAQTNGQPNYNAAAMAHRKAEAKWGKDHAPIRTNRNWRNRG